MDGKYYCMAPPNTECDQVRKAEGRVYQGGERKFFIVHTRSPVLNAKNFLAINVASKMIKYASIKKGSAYLCPCPFYIMK